jgi:hypothetical protein
MNDHADSKTMFNVVNLQNCGEGGLLYFGSEAWVIKAANGKNSAKVFIKTTHNT